MTSSECFRCGSSVSEPFGSEYICDDSVPGSRDPLTESERSSENTLYINDERDGYTQPSGDTVYPKASRTREWWVALFSIGVSDYEMVLVCSGHTRAC